MAKRSAKKSADATKPLAVQAARIAEANNAEDIVVLNLRALSPVTDYFVICTGTSDRQMRTVADEICRYGKSVGSSVWHVAGMESGDWIVLDFVDVVVHIFDQKRRGYYDLELIWGDAPRLRWRAAKSSPK